MEVETFCKCRVQIGYSRCRSGSESAQSCSFFLLTWFISWSELVSYISAPDWSAIGCGWSVPAFSFCLIMLVKTNETKYQTFTFVFNLYACVRLMINNKNVFFIENKPKSAFLHHRQPKLFWTPNFECMRTKHSDN